MNDEHGRHDEAVSTTPKWAVYQCMNGCVHVHLQHVSLTFSAREFAQFVQLLGDAYVRLGVRATVESITPH